MKDETDSATIDIEDVIKGMHRNPDHETSVKAARGVRRFTLREIVADYAREQGHSGFTDEDLKLLHPPRPESSLRKRRTELAQENRIINTGRTRHNGFGQEEIVWVHRDFHPSPPPIIERDTTPKQSKLVRLEAQVAELTEIVRLAYPHALNSDTFTSSFEHGKLLHRMRAHLEA